MACSTRIIFVLCLVLLVVGAEEKVGSKKDSVKNDLVKKQSKRTVNSDKFVGDSETKSKEQKVNDTSSSIDVKSLQKNYYSKEQNDSTHKHELKPDIYQVSPKFNTKGPRPHPHPFYYSKKAIHPYIRFDGHRVLKPIPFSYYKPSPYEVKVPSPKRVPSYKVPFERPYSVQVEKPYPVYFEKRVPYPVLKVVPYPVKLPVEKTYPYNVPVHHYSVEKKLPVQIPPFKHFNFNFDSHFPQHEEKPVAHSVKNEEHADDKPNSAQEYSTPFNHDEFNHDWIPKQVARAQEHYRNFNPSEQVTNSASQNEHVSDEYESLYQNDVQNQEPSEPVYSAFYHIPAAHYEADEVHPSPESWSSASGTNEEISPSSTHYRTAHENDHRLPIEQNFKNPSEYPSGPDSHYQANKGEFSDPNQIFGSKTFFNKPNQHSPTFEPYVSQKDNLYNQQYSDFSHVTYDHPNKLEQVQNLTESHLESPKHHFYSTSYNKNFFDKFMSTSPDMSLEHDDRPKSYVEKDFHGYYRTRIIH